MEFWINKNLPQKRLEVMLHHTDKGSHYIASPVLLTQVTPDLEGSHFPPTVSLKTEEAQQLMDELWRCGVRPSDDIGSTGQLSALQDHLKDMRQLVAAFMELKK